MAIELSLYESSVESKNSVLYTIEWQLKQETSSNGCKQSKKRRGLYGLTHRYRTALSVSAGSPKLPLGNTTVENVEWPYVVNARIGFANCRILLMTRKFVFALTALTH